MQRNRISSASLFRQLSTFPGSRPPSIIDVKELNFRVRDGNGWILLAIATGFRVSVIPSKLNNVSLSLIVPLLLSSLTLLVKPSVY